MKIICSQEEVPKAFLKSIFLAGPTPRSKDVQSWRPEAIKILEELGFDGVVFNPERNNKSIEDNFRYGYAEQIEWEEKCLNLADCIIFWIPRELKTMPAFTTNDEWGRWKNSGKAVFGAPKDAEKTSYQEYYAKKLKVPTADTLKETIENSLKMIGEGALRVGGETEVPLYIWKAPHFQKWYSAQKSAGNRLDGAKVEWVFRVGPDKKFIFVWALHVDIYIASENRHKINEIVISRPDISVTVMYKKGKSLNDTSVVLIREFRSPASTIDGFVWEAPGGSSLKKDEKPETLAANECKEETGLIINPNRIRIHESRQLVATLSGHKANLFSVEITEEEINYLKSQQGIAHGVIEDSERTYVEIKNIEEIKKEGKVDWSMLGMILSVLTEIFSNKKTEEENAK